MSEMLASQAMTQVTCPTCIVCQRNTKMVVSASGLRKWNTGALIQDAFPELSYDDREVLMTGIHPACWTALFEEEGDDEELPDYED